LIRFVDDAVRPVTTSARLDLDGRFVVVAGARVVSWPRRAARVVPLGRIGDPDTDIAPVVVFLLSDDARYMTGQTVVVDGGRFTTL
jgi:NAD(P)-dependent dehydrogenase (short-subunit alcohol dehydrogenase family)